MANTYVDYTGDGNTTSFAYTFAVLSGRQQDHIIVGVDDSTTTGGKFEVVDPADYTIDTSAGTITFDTAPELNARIRIRRDSDASTLLVDFKNGTVLPERDLDLAYLHNLFLNEEIEEGSGKNTLVKNADGNYDGDSVKLVNLADPENAQDAVTKGYADGRYVDEAGDTMTGNLDMGSNEVTSSAVPSGNNSLTNKSYVDGEVATEAAARITGDSEQVTRTGDSMSGDLTMTSPAKVVQAAAPTTANDLTNKTYVDGVVAAEASNRASGDATLTNSKVSKSGDTMTGALTLPASDPSSDNHATRKRYVDQRIAVAVSSGTPGGPIETDNIDDGAITTVKIDDGAVTTAKIEDDAITFAKLQDINSGTVIGRSKRDPADTGDPEAVTILDEDDMTSDSDTSLATQQSIKAYVDGAVGGVTGATNLGQTLTNTSVEITSSTGDNTTIAGAVASGNAGVMTGADKALLDSAVQPNDNISTLNNDSGFTANAGTVTSVDSGTGLTGGPITASGTIGIAAKGVTSTELQSDATNDTNRAVTTNHIKDNAVTPAKTAFDNLAISNTSGGSSLTVTGSGQAFIEVGGAAGNLAYIDIKNPTSDDYDLRLVSDDRTPMASVHQSRARVEGVTSLGLCAGTAGSPLSEIVTVKPTEIFIKNSTAVPTTNPTGGGFLYVDSGDLKYRDPNGAIKTFGGVSKFDSGWVNQDNQGSPTTVNNNVLLTFSHGRSTDELVFYFQVADDSSGTNARSVLDHQSDDNTSNMLGAQIQEITSSTVKIRLGQSYQSLSAGSYTGVSFTNKYVRLTAIG